MPLSAPHPCTSPGCPELVRGRGRCDAHEAKAEARRGTSNSRGYGSKWQAYRLRFLAAHPLCSMCEAENRVTPSTVVDHVRAHKGDQQLFWDPANHRAVCKPHHDQRTDEGDFGRPIPQEKPHGR